MMNKILIVDDDAYIRELVGTVIKNEGFDVLEAADGRDALAKLGEEKVDLCILDIMMPGMDGYEFCRSVRRYYDFPILMLTARAETAQKVKGFELGADDYLTKPFEPAELAVRVKALLKRYQIAYSHSFQIGGLRIDTAGHTITAGGKILDIPLKEFELLALLGSYPGKTMPRDRLIEDVWGYDFDGNERTLDVHINRLRERFPEGGFGFKITTIRGLGYRLEVTA
jgi:DNA-binding response OmpR family regulator